MGRSLNILRTIAELTLINEYVKSLIFSALPDIRLQLYEISQGLAYLHSQHIVHGDLRGVRTICCGPFVYQSNNLIVKHIDK